MNKKTLNIIIILLVFSIIGSFTYGYFTTERLIDEQLELSYEKTSLEDDLDEIEKTLEEVKEDYEEVIRETTDMKNEYVKHAEQYDYLRYETFYVEDDDEVRWSLLFDKNADDYPTFLEEEVYN